MMAWLGTALKSSQPRRSASCRSESVMVRITGAAAASEVVALPGTEVGMVVSLTAFGEGVAKARSRWIDDRSQARARRQTGFLAMPRTEPDASANPLESLLTVR